MKTSILLTFLGLIVLGSGGCTGGNTYNSNANAANRSGNSVMNTVANTAANAASAVANTAAGITVASPADFMHEAEEGGMAEFAMGKLAAQKAQNAEVKKFAQMMVDDHSKANEELKGLAAKKNFTLPTDASSHKSEMDELNGLSGADFEKEYVEMMVDDHEKDVAAFQKQADSGSDADVKAFAMKTLPTLKKHLEAINAIHAKMK